MEVGGDPVGSTDPEWILWGPQILRCSRIYIPAPIRHVKMPLYPTLGVQHQNHACSGRSAPGCSHSGRSAPELCSVLAFERQTDAPPGCDFSSTVFDSVFEFFVYFVTPHDHEPKKT